MCWTWTLIWYKQTNKQTNKIHTNYPKIIICLLCINWFDKIIALQVNLSTIILFSLWLWYGIYCLLNKFNWTLSWVSFIYLHFVCTHSGAGEIAQSLASLSIKWAVQVRARLDPLVTERWNSITMLLTHSRWRLVQKRRSMCYYVCVIMHVKDP